jgi:hypothetical protein
MSTARRIVTLAVAAACAGACAAALLVATSASAGTGQPVTRAAFAPVKVKATKALRQATVNKRAIASLTKRVAALEAATAPGTVPTPAAPLGIQIVTGSSAYDFGAGFKTGAATCPAGTRLVGGGGWVQGVTGPKLVESSPRATTTTWFAQGLADVNPGAWQVTAYAFCVSP